MYIGEIYHFEKKAHCGASVLKGDEQQIQIGLCTFPAGISQLVDFRPFYALSSAVGHAQKSKIHRTGS